MATFTAPIVKQPAGATQNAPAPATSVPGQNYSPMNAYGTQGINGMLTNSANLVSNVLSGTTYAPFAAGQQEALARQEATQRANTAQQINQAGFSGTGMGSQIGGAAENTINQNRFASNNAIEQGQIASQLSGLPMVSAVQANAQTALTNANQNFAAYVQNSPNATVNDPQVQAYAAQVWQSQGNQGQPPASFVQSMLTNAQRATNAYTAQVDAINQAVSQGSLTAAQGQTLSKFVGSGQTQFLTTDANGNVTIDWNAVNSASQAMQGMGQSTSAASYTIASTGATGSTAGATNTGGVNDVSPVFQSITNGQSFDTDKYGAALGVWAQQNAGKTVTISGTQYQVVGYTAPTEKGASGVLTLKDPMSGQNVTYEGTGSENTPMTSGQRQQNNSNLITNLASAGTSGVIQDAKNGNWGGVVMDALGAGNGLGTIRQVGQWLGWW